MTAILIISFMFSMMSIIVCISYICEPQEQIATLIAFIIIGIISTAVWVILLVIKIKQYKAKQEFYKNLPPQYEKKEFLTAAEKEYRDIIRSILKKDYILQPQICLFSIIKKNHNLTTYIGNNELMKIVDFGIFYHDEIIALIEINDNSHYRKDRKKRDLQVATVCKIANIPLITFWMDKGINVEEMRKEIYHAIYNG